MPSARGLRDQARSHPVVVFITLAFVFSWAAWLPLLVGTQGWIDARPSSALHLIGSLGPATAALVVVGLTEGFPGVRRLGRQLIAWRGR